MVDPDISRYASLLKQQYLFQGLDDAQLAHVVTRFERIEKRQDELIYSQGSSSDLFYVIFQGSVRVSRMDGHHERQLRLLGAGDYFGEDTLLFDRPRSDSVTTREPSVLLSMDREAFFDLLELVPEIRMNLSATAESRHLALKENFDWLGEDEVVYLISRKHEFFLLTSLLLPILLGIISLPILVLSFSAESIFLSNAGSLVGILGLVGSGLWGIWNWIDWGNDFYIVTSRRVVWLERVIIFYYSRQETPLTHVLSVNVTSSYIGRLLKFGNVDVRTFTGGIPMRMIPNPKRFASFVEGYQSRARRQMKEAEVKIMEKELRKRLRIEKEPPPSEAFHPPSQKPEGEKPDKVKPGTLRDILDTFLQVRYERDGIITYRKHWLVLIGKIWLPSLAFLLLVVVSIYLLNRYLFHEGLGISGLTMTFVFGIFYIAVLIWGGYHYLDWNNDIYQLSPDQIIDIERRPLGEEQKKTAPLDSILSLEHAREGIIQLVFNYGDVVVNVGQTKFIFRGVHNPDQVHQDVADFIEARRRKKQDIEAERERQRMLDWLGTYKQQTDKLDESKKDTDWDLFPG